MGDGNCVGTYSQSDVTARRLKLKHIETRLVVSLIRQAIHHFWAPGQAFRAQVPSPSCQSRYLKLQVPNLGAVTVTVGGWRVGATGWLAVRTGEVGVGMSVGTRTPSSAIHQGLS